jgi:hypothetical protein
MKTDTNKISPEVLPTSYFSIFYHDLKQGSKEYYIPITLQDIFQFTNI